MQMRQFFKNPGGADEESDADSMDELVETVDELGMPIVEAGDVRESDDSEIDIGEQMLYMYGVVSDDDYDYVDADEDSDEDEDDDEQMSTKEQTQKAGTSGGTSTNHNKATNTNNTKQQSNARTDSDEDSDEDDDGGGGGGTSGGVFDLNEDEEEDETVRAMIAAIKKPRTSPPEIKLDDFITDICFHPERDIIALASIIGDVYLYKYANEGNTLLRTIEIHSKACRDVEFTEDGCSLLTCSKDKSVMVTDMETEKLKKFYETAHEEAINKIYVLDENLFSTGDDGGTVKLWDLRTKDAIFDLKLVEDQITQLLTNDAKKLLLSTSGSGYLTTINIGARKMYVQSEPYEEELNCMGIYRGDSKLVVGTSLGRLYTYNWGQFAYHCDVYPNMKTPINEMIPITDRIACVAGEEGIIRACHIAPYRTLGVVGQHNMPIESLDISNNGELIASSSHNNDVRFWNVKYFEDFGDIKYNEKHNTYKEKRHNLPSSKYTNASSFFADLDKPPSDNE